MKLLIFENEFIEMEGAFEYLNTKYFKGSLSWRVCQRSQDIKDITELNEYDLIIIDIDLSYQSELDGFSLIKKIERELNPTPSIIIISGHKIVDDYDTIHAVKRYPYLEKPVNFKKLYIEFRKLNE